MRARWLLAFGALGCISDNDVRERVITDSWFQAPNNEVDILWVVDDSCSMTDEQETLVGGFSSFISEIEASGTDFHVGVITTSLDYADPDRGRLIGDPPFLTGADDYLTGFAERAQVGVDGSDKEKGLEAAVYALSPTMTTGPNSGFLRPDAQLLVIFVSDEEDCSDEGALEGQPAEACYLEDDELVPVAEFVEDLRRIKGNDRDKVLVGSIVGVESSTCDDAYVGSRYIEAAAFTGGLASDICLSDWSSTLTDLGLNASGIKMSFQTSYLAKPETLEVTVDGEEVLEDTQNGWSYDTESWYLTFHGEAVPERDAEISAKYTVQPGAEQPGG